MTDAAATILFASKQGFAKVLIVGEMPNGDTKIMHDANLPEILETLDKARAHLDFMIERTKHSR